MIYRCLGIMSLFLLSHVCQAMPNDLRFFKDFPDFDSIRASTVRKMPIEKRNNYLSQSREALELTCSSAIWGGTPPTLAQRLKAFVASSKYPDIQAKFAVRWIMLDRSNAAIAVGYYRDSPFEHLDWIKNLVETARNDCLYDMESFQMTVALYAAEAVKPDQQLMECSIWTAFLGKIITADELEVVGRETKSIDKLDYIIRSYTPDPLEIYSFLWTVLPNEVWNDVRKRKSNCPPCRFEDYFYISYLSRVNYNDDQRFNPCYKQDEWIQALKEWIEIRSE